LDSQLYNSCCSWSSRWICITWPWYISHHWDKWSTKQTPMPLAYTQRLNKTTAAPALFYYYICKTYGTEGEYRMQYNYRVFSLFPLLFLSSSSHHPSVILRTLYVSWEGHCHTSSSIGFSSNWFSQESTCNRFLQAAGKSSVFRQATSWAKERQSATTPSFSLLPYSD
jgi:hypothetical protein